MKKQIETHFPIVLTNGCLQTVSEIEFGISEPEKDKGGRSIIVEKAGADFEVDNPNQKDIVFWAIDECTLSSGDGPKCDFAIFDDETFAFVEIKRNSYKNRSKAKVKAVEQLSEILELSKGKLNFDEVKLLAIMALKFKSSVPVGTTRKQEARLTFFNKYRAHLLEGDEIAFPYEEK
jgi:hypothetical protein